MGLSEADLEKIRATIISVFKDEILKDLERNIAVKVQECVESEVLVLRNNIQKLNQDVKGLKSEKKSMEALLDRQEQMSRSLNIRIFGVPQQENEDLGRIVLDLLNKKSGSNIKETDIKKCHRVGKKKLSDNVNTQPPRMTRSGRSASVTGLTGEGGDIDRPPAILVQFSSDAVRTEVLSKRKQTQTMGIRIREDLTKSRLNLLAKTIERFGYKNAWCLHGIIYAKAGNNVHRIADTDSLENLPRLRGSQTKTGSM